MVTVKDCTVEILSALLRKGQQYRQNQVTFDTNPVAGATGYNHVTLKGVFGWHKG
ncbi:hypothetical protein [Cyclobacterium qasimii]|uniref:hypothetical protein n=1 Tax=Cyclobacterium qasimii TaxID=1350429 RepID=UPI0014782BC4|nr:hypothetical protein [Cyclobacterium qasimii]